MSDTPNFRFEIVQRDEDGERVLKDVELYEWGIEPWGLGPILSVSPPSPGRTP